VSSAKIDCTIFPPVRRISGGVEEIRLFEFCDPLTILVVGDKDSFFHTQRWLPHFRLTSSSSCLGLGLAKMSAPAPTAQLITSRFKDNSQIED
jgi:hypothetical protein